MGRPGCACAQSIMPEERMLLLHWVHLCGHVCHLCLTGLQYFERMGLLLKLSSNQHGQGQEEGKTVAEFILQAQRFISGSCPFSNGHLQVSRFHNSFLIFKFLVHVLLLLRTNVMELQEQKVILLKKDKSVDLFDAKSDSKQRHLVRKFKISGKCWIDQLVKSRLQQYHNFQVILNFELKKA